MKVRQSGSWGTLAVAISVAALAMAPATGQAYVMSSSVIQLDNLQFSDAATGTVLDFSDFTFLTFTGSADLDVTLGAANNSSASSIAPIDLPVLCLGSACPVIAENTFPQLTAPPVGNYSTSDQVESGAPITGVPIPGGGGATFTTPATVANAAYTALTTDSTLASADSNNNLQSSFVFTPGAAIQVALDFDANSFLQVAVTSDEVFPSFATAAYSQSFSIIDLSNNGALVWSFTPDGSCNDAGCVLDPVSLNDTRSLNAPLPVDVEITAGTGGAFQSYRSVTPFLTPGVLYQFSARTNANADSSREAVQVPGPLSLVMVGVGVLALGASAAARRRRR